MMIIAISVNAWREQTGPRAYAVDGVGAPVTTAWIASAAMGMLASFKPATLIRPAGVEKECERTVAMDAHTVSLLWRHSLPQYVPELSMYTWKSSTMRSDCCLLSPV